MQPVRERRFHAIESVGHPVNVAYLVAVIRGDGPLGDPQSRFMKLDEYLSIEMPLIGIQQKGNLLERLTTVQPVAGMKLGEFHSDNMIFEPGEDLVADKLVQRHAARARIGASS